MDVPSTDIDLCRRSHDRLRKAIAGLADDDVRAPSLLPGWSVGHVLNHIARNADSVLRRLHRRRLIRSLEGQLLRRVHLLIRRLIGSAADEA